MKRKRTLMVEVDVSFACSDALEYLDQSGYDPLEVLALVYSDPLIQDQVRHLLQSMQRAESLRRRAAVASRIHN